MKEMWQNFSKSIWSVIAVFCFFFFGFIFLILHFNLWIWILILGIPLILLRGFFTVITNIFK